MMDSLSLPSMSTYFPMTIISIDMSKELMNHTASKISLNKGGVNQNHLHHLQHTSDECSCTGNSDNFSILFGSDIRNKNIGVKLYHNSYEDKKAVHDL